MKAPVAGAHIRISDPDLGPEVEALVLSVLRSGQLAQGPMVQRFEQLCARMAGTEHAVAVANGTVALEAALEVSGIGPGDEVITSPFTFAATLNAILRRGAKACFADITDDFTIDATEVAALVAESTAAIMPVHLYGLMADMEALSGIAAGHGLAMIEDAAQAHGATQHGRRAGSFGLGCFSFYATKNVTAGEGGCITTDDAQLADRLSVLRNQGMRSRYEFVDIGTNGRLTEVAAAIAIPQLERLETAAARRAANAAALSESLAGDRRITTPAVPAGRTHAWHQYTVLLAPGVDRDGVVRDMADAGVETGVYYPRPVWDHPPYLGHPRVKQAATPRAVDAAARCLSLPVHPRLSGEDLERVASGLLEAVARRI